MFSYCQASGVWARTHRLLVTSQKADASLLRPRSSDAIHPRVQTHTHLSSSPSLSWFLLLSPSLLPWPQRRKPMTRSWTGSAGRCRTKGLPCTLAAPTTEDERKDLWLQICAGSSRSILRTPGWQVGLGWRGITCPLTRNADEGDC